MDQISNIEDITRMNYSEGWLPPCDELRRELIAAWKQYEKRRKEQGRHPRGGVPAMPILDGHAQPGPDQKRCYGCGCLILNVRLGTKLIGKVRRKDLKEEWKSAPSLRTDEAKEREARLSGIEEKKG